MTSAADGEFFIFVDVGYPLFSLLFCLRCVVVNPGLVHRNTRRDLNIARSTQLANNFLSPKIAVNVWYFSQYASNLGYVRQFQLAVIYNAFMVFLNDYV